MRISDWSSDVCYSDLQLLEHRRQQREHREDQHAEKEAEERSEQEIALLEQREIDEGVLRGQRVADGQVKKEHRERTLVHGFGRSEQIELLPAIEHQLQRSDAKREHNQGEQREPGSDKTKQL